MKTPKMPRLSRPLCVTYMLAIMTVPAPSDQALADCVAPLASCAVECDQRTKVGDPDRPQCAQTCISGYNRCLRVEQIQSNTDRPVLNQRSGNAPVQ